MVLVRRQPGFREMYRRNRIGGCVRAIRDANEGPRIVIDGDIRNPTTQVFCRVPINRRSCITRINKRNRESETVSLPGNVRLICGGMRLKEAASMAVVVVPVANIKI